MKIFSIKSKQRFVNLVDEVVPAAIEHNHHFFPGTTLLYLKPMGVNVNNHEALFMQGIYYCGKLFERRKWTDITRDFAERFFASGHPDGYFEEHTNAQRQGGPSLRYTPLTAGALYDVLDGKNRPRQKFLTCGSFYRKFLTTDYSRILIADERTNSTGGGLGYGAALHSLSPEVRS